MYILDTVLHQNVRAVKKLTTIVLQMLAEDTRFWCRDKRTFSQHGKWHECLAHLGLSCPQLPAGSHRAVSGERYCTDSRFCVTTEELQPQEAQIFSNGLQETLLNFHRRENLLLLHYTLKITKPFPLTWRHSIFQGCLLVQMSLDRCLAQKAVSVFAHKTVQKLIKNRLP